jgi:hypothetical protein
MIIVFTPLNLGALGFGLLSELSYRSAKSNEQAQENLRTKGVHRGLFTTYRVDKVKSEGIVLDVEDIVERKNFIKEKDSTQSLSTSKTNIGHNYESYSETTDKAKIKEKTKEYIHEAEPTHVVLQSRRINLKGDDAGPYTSFIACQEKKEEFTHEDLIKEFVTYPSFNQIKNTFSRRDGVYYKANTHQYEKDAVTLSTDDREKPYYIGKNLEAILKHQFDPALSKNLGNLFAGTAVLLLVGDFLTDIIRT